MKNASGNVTSSSSASQKLRLDFYESGLGETIIITFPSGGIGVVDAHPSKVGSRPKILDLVKGKRVHFVCLTHPHQDHGLDLIQILKNHPKVESFWHTIFETPAFLYLMGETTNFPSDVQKYVSKMNQDWGDFFIDILGEVVTKNIPDHLLRSNLFPDEIDGVKIHCLSPSEEIQNEFSKTYRAKLQKPETEIPDPNLLSAVLALRFGESVVLLGADALTKNWTGALQNYHKRKLPKTVILKVPHHGARNAFDLRKKATTYLDICSHQPKAKAVIFAGDANHPDNDVFGRIRSRADTVCLSNGRKSALASLNPLKLQLPGASYVHPAHICNAVVSFELDGQGNVSLTRGVECDAGCLATARPAQSAK
jgi:beta-lactamase superfamily II metal-dependent hydrolase